MLDVTIKGFQSIEEVSLTIDGFAALVGRSNIGKSAIVRAVQSALTNALGTDFVRHGEFCSRRIRGTKKCKCQCSVHLKTTGFDLLWEKGDEVNQYTFNGEVYSKVDRGIPDFLKDFSLVKVGDKKQLVQVAEQSEPIFLLNQPGTVVADVLADVAKLDEINLAMADAEKDRKEAASTLKVRERDVVELTMTLQFYDGLDDPVQRVKVVSQDFTAIEGLVRQKDRLDGFYERLRDLGTGVRFLQPVEAVEIPDVEPIGASEKGFSVLLGYETSLAYQSREVTNLEGVEDVPEPDVSPLETAGETILQFTGWLRKASELKMDLSVLKDIEATADMADPPEVESLVRLSSFEGEYQTLMLGIDELESIELTPDPEETVHGVSGLVSITEFSERYDSLTASVGTLETTLSELEVQEKDLLAECRALGVCPTCSQTITEDHYLHLDA